jgi:hypothetical protein
LKKPITKRGWWSGFKVEALSSKPNTEKKKKRKRKVLELLRPWLISNKEQVLSSNPSTDLPHERKVMGKCV